MNYDQCLPSEALRVGGKNEQERPTRHCELKRWLVCEGEAMPALRQLRQARNPQPTEHVTPSTADPFEVLRHPRSHFIGRGLLRRHVNDEVVTDSLQ